MRVAVVGAGGKMGVETCRSVAAAEDFELVAAIHPRCEGRNLAEIAGVGPDITITADLRAATEAGAQLLVDFSRAPAGIAAMEFAAANRLHVVSGTTGIESTELDRLARLFAPVDAPNAVHAANFSLSAAVLLRLAEIAAPHFPMVEIIELHHERKVDAPSGTALETAEHLAAARREAGEGPFESSADAVEVLPGARGALGPAGVRLHSVRLAGLLAHEEVVFGAPGQTLTLRQDTLDRSAYMPGVLLALRAVASTPGLTRGLAPLLHLS